MVSLNMLEEYPCRIIRSSTFFTQKTRRLSDFCIAAFIIWSCPEGRGTGAIPVGEEIRLGIVIPQLGVFEGEVGLRHWPGGQPALHLFLPGDGGGDAGPFGADGQRLRVLLLAILKLRRLHVYIFFVTSGDFVSNEFDDVL